MIFSGAIFHKNRLENQGQIGRLSLVLSCKALRRIARQSGGGRVRNAAIPRSGRGKSPFSRGSLQPVTILLPFDKIRAIPFPRQPSCVIVEEIQKKGIRSYEKIYAGV